MTNGNGNLSHRHEREPSLRTILTSCAPSLIHLMPILYHLGIRNVDHFRALGRLSEETRDREVRDAAFREGITVVEWAILVDKMKY